MTGIVLSDIAEVFTHPFIKSSLGVENVLFEAYDASYTINDTIRFAVALSDGIILASSYLTCDRPWMVLSNAVSALMPLAFFFYLSWLFVGTGLISKIGGGVALTRMSRMF